MIGARVNVRDTLFFTKKSAFYQLINDSLVSCMAAYSEVSYRMWIFACQGILLTRSGVIVCCLIMVLAAARPHIYSYENQFDCALQRSAM
jgi:hypothetical protein